MHFFFPRSNCVLLRSLFISRGKWRASLRAMRAPLLPCHDRQTCVCRGHADLALYLRKKTRDSHTSECIRVFVTYNTLLREATKNHIRRTGTSHSVLCWISENLSVGLRWPELDNNHSLLSIAQVTYSWSHASAPHTPLWFDLFYFAVKVNSVERKNLMVGWTWRMYPSIPASAAEYSLWFPVWAK